MKYRKFSNLNYTQLSMCHYKSNIYKSILQKYSVKQSISKKGNYYDNAYIENFFGYLKIELI